MANKQVVTFRIDPWINEKVEEEAERRNLTNSGMYRSIIQGWLERFHQPKEAIVETMEGRRVRVRYRMGAGESDIEFSSVELL